jgi:putative transposase
VHIYLVFMTRYRGEVLTKLFLDDLRGIFASICGGSQAELVEFDAEDDHIELLVPSLPKFAGTTLVNSLKDR